MTSKRVIPISKPDVSSLEIMSVSEVLRTPYLSRGQKTKDFEEKIASYIGVKYGVSVNSGTSALHLAVRSLGLKKGDEVITTPFSFIASSNCLLMENVRPVFVDVRDSDYNINPDLIESKITPKTKAILPVHVFGQPCEMDTIKAIANRHSLKIIEDSCEAIGAEYNRKKAGSFGDISALAFYPNKQITTGEGGIILTDDEEIANLCRSMRCHGIEEKSGRNYFERLGYNYHLDEMSAALGLAQFSRLEKILEKRKQVAESYREKLKGVEGISMPEENYNTKKSWFVFTLEIKEKRDEVMNVLNESGIQCKEYFSAIHLQPLYRREFGYSEGDFPVTERLSSQNLAIPFYNSLSEKDIKYIVKKLKGALRK